MPRPLFFHETRRKKIVNIYQSVSEFVSKLPSSVFVFRAFNLVLLSTAKIPNILKDIRKLDISSKFSLNTFVTTRMFTDLGLNDIFVR